MPYTLSHIAVIIPFNSRPFVVSGLIIGCMSPDFLYFVPFIPGAHFTHTFAGLFYFCLPVSLALYYLYTKFLKQSVVSLLPKQLKTQPENCFRSRSNYWLVISIIIGAATHIVWDSFTHPTGYAVLNLALLKQRIILFDYPIQVFKLLQYLSSVLGGIVVVYWLGLHIRRRIKSKRELYAALSHLRNPLLMLLCLGMLGAMSSLMFNGNLGVKIIVVQAVIISMSLCGFALIFHSIVWHIKNKE